MLTEQPLAKRSTRLFASLIDLLVMGLCGLPVFAFIVVQIVTSRAGGAGWIVLISFLTLLLLGVYQVYLLTTSGQTIGKKAMGIRIVRVDTGGLPGFGGAVALRWLVPALIGAIPYIGWTFGVADVLFIFADDRRCLHDHIAGTKVVTASAPLTDITSVPFPRGPVAGT